MRATIGATFIRLGRFDRAEPHARRALEIRRNLFGDEHTETIQSLTLLGLLYSNWEKPEEAERFTRNAVELARQMGDQRDEALGEPLLNLASLQNERGNFDEAEAMYREVVAMWQKRGDEFTVAWAKQLLAGVLNSKGEYQGAEALYRESLEGFRSTVGDQHPMVASALYGLGVTKGRLDASEQIQRSEGDCVAALPLLEEAVEIDAASLGENASPRMRTAYGQCFTRLERYPEAEEQLLTAYAALSERGRIPSDITQTLEGLVELYRAWGKRERADVYRTLLEETEQTLPPTPGPRNE